MAADYHAIAFATAFLARNPISKPRSFAGLAGYRNFFVHCLLAHKPGQAHCSPSHYAAFSVLHLCRVRLIYLFRLLCGTRMNIVQEGCQLFAQRFVHLGLVPGDYSFLK